MGEMTGAGSSAAANMDAIYRYQRHVYDLTRKYYLLGRDRMIDGLAPPLEGSILEVGCGTGRNLVLAARRYPQARLAGFDISRAMLETAKHNIARAGLEPRIRLAVGDASEFSASALFGEPGFDRVFISYALSMIPPWQQAASAALAALKPGGSLHIVDFGMQEGLPRAFRTGLHAWLAKFSVTPRADLHVALADLAQQRGATLRMEHLYRDYARLAVLTRPA